MNKIIVLSIATFTVLTFSGCDNGDKHTEAAKATASQAAETTKDAATKTVEAAKETVSKATEAVKESASKAAEVAKETTEKAVDATKEAASKAAETVKESANKAVEVAKETTEKAVDATKEAAAKATNAVASAGANDKGKAVFTKCQSCHGADGKTKALGKSEIIGGQSAEDLVKKIQEYKAGTRNVAGMGQLMNGQVKNLSDEDIKAVAAYISSLK